MSFHYVYGPVNSWRFGRSLGIDPIGTISTCSFDCVYCQLGAIERLQIQRQIFIPTEQILQDLQLFAPWDVDVITLSGSGEPTLALNLGEILAKVKEMTAKPLVVLTNGTLLNDPDVRAALALTDRVAVKLDAVSDEQLRRVNRPVAELNLGEIWQGIEQFRAEYPGKLAVQTMILSAWNSQVQSDYINRIKQLVPDEIQLNTPSRPKPLTRQLDGRGNNQIADCAYPVNTLKCVDADYLKTFADRIQQQTGVLVRWKISQ
ncbi:radical SAM protein [Aerosakkonemataceae cyanobacterium BLCC-F154]|uniref:Radical SAM protein n=1 Tax=Floridaenema fluviatile BLCC-F154 TaxID=3153640 RepID=A0ABV4Y6E9_9CYAN